MRPYLDLDRLRDLKTLPQLIAYLRDDLDWPVDQDAVEDDVTFQYAPEELGFDAATAVHIKEIKQLRPLDSRQPWGVFWVNFEKKRLPVVMLRRILGNLILKKRADAKKATQRAWHLHDLLFISAYGEESDRAITFAHFSQPPDSPADLPILKVLGWDDGDTVLHLVEAHRTLAEKLRWPAKSTSLDEWRNQWSSAFTLRHREVITTTNELVEELARLADATRKRARTILAGESERGPLRRLYAAFKAALIHDLNEDDFADVIAQTISYGLLIARFSRAAISAQNLVDMVPATNPFLRELLGTFLALAGRQSAFDFDELGIQDVVEVLNRSNADAVKADFGNRTRDEDPVIHFYEHFLAAYDRQKKIQRGVFYTPQPAVSYIVRGVHESLQKEFGIEDGLASTVTWGDMLKKHPELKLPKIRVPKAGKAEGEEVDLSSDEFFVLILDIATGTGTFLVETIEVIFQHLQAKWEMHGLKGMPIIRHTALRTPQFKDYWNAYVPAALLPRLYGYELMMAPYTIAHMKLALKFSEINARLGQTDYLFKFDGRAHIYLTNTLEPPSGFQEQEFAQFFPALAHEAAAVKTVKRTKRFTVVIGNPPYSGESANDIAWVRDLVKSKYEYIEGTKIEEKGKKNWLLNDYVKFIRVAHFITEHCQLGVVGLITPHSFLDNPTFRAMRYALIKDFKLLFLLDLHGNYDKREKCPDGSKDENVFDITQGVAISLFLKRDLSNVASKPKGEVFLSELWGLRESNKYPWLLKNSCQRKEASLVRPDEKFYFFKHGGERDDEYESWWPLNKLFQVNGNGVITAHDHFSIAFDDQELAERLDTYINPRLTDAEVLERLQLRENSMWEIGDARIALRRARSEDRFVNVLYRPFDLRRTFFHKSVVFNLRLPVMKHMVAGGNLALICSRMTKGESFAHAFVSRTISEAILLSSKTSNNAFSFPVGLKDEDEEEGLFRATRDSFHSNFSPAFLRNVSERFISPDGVTTALQPIEVFNYIYAVLHSPGYRSRYAEFLKIDFPRLPLTGNLDLFRALARLGGELVALHLLESPKLDHPITEYLGGRAPEVEKVSWSKNTVWLDKTQTTGFKGVREDVWNFHIGGYQVCEKWLKDRKGRQLTAEDRAHYQNIVVALSETIRLMKEIDAEIERAGGWPLK